MSGHIEKDLAQTKQMVINMISIAISQYDDMYKCLIVNNLNLAHVVIETDLTINKMREAFIEVSLWKIAKRQMVAGDLRRIIGYISVVHKLERISDYAKSICSFYIKNKPNNELIIHLQKLLKKIKEMLIDISKIFDNENIELVYIITRHSIELEKIYENENERLINKICESKSKEEIRLVILIMQQLSYIERASHYIINIAEILNFIIEGYSYNFVK